MDVRRLHAIMAAWSHPLAPVRFVTLIGHITQQDTTPTRKTWTAPAFPLPFSNNKRIVCTMWSSLFGSLCFRCVLVYLLACQLLSVPAPRKQCHRCR